MQENWSERKEYRGNIRATFECICINKLKKEALVRKKVLDL